MVKSAGERSRCRQWILFGQREGYVLELRIKTLIKYTLALIHQKLTFISENNFQVLWKCGSVLVPEPTINAAVFPYDLCIYI